MANINSLPIEIISDILEAATPTFPDQRYRFLARASLVCKIWSEVGRVLLWQVVEIESERLGKRILRSAGLGAYPTLRVRITALEDGLGGVDAEWDGVSSETAINLVSRVKGLQHLELGSFVQADALSFRILQSPNLADLATLNLSGTFFYYDTANNSVPFSLRRLHMSRCETISLLPSSIFSRPSLTEMAIFLPRKPVEDSVHTDFSRIQAIANQLRSLTLTLHDHGPNPRKLLPIISSCASLANLDLIHCSTEQFVSIISIVPAPLDNLLIEFGLRPINQIVQVLNSVINASSSIELKRLTIRRSRRRSEKEFIASAAVKELAEKFEDRGALVQMKEIVTW